MHRHKKPCSYLSCQLTAYLDCLQCALQGSWDCSDITHAQQALQQVGLCSHVLTARCFAGWLGHNRLCSRLPFLGLCLMCFAHRLMLHKHQILQQAALRRLVSSAMCFAGQLRLHTSITLCSRWPYQHTFGGGMACQAGLMEAKHPWQTCFTSLTPH